MKDKQSFSLNQKSKIKNHKKLILISFIFAAVIFNFQFSIFNFSDVFAQKVRTITIVPPNISYSLVPGGTAEGVMKVINDSSEEITFQAYVRDFIVEDKKGTPKILPPNTLSGNYSASAWIGVTPDVFTVKPHEKQILNYFVQVPSYAKPGGHYAAVVYEPQSIVSLQTSGAGVGTQLGTLVYINVAGPVTENAKVALFAPQNPFQEYGPVKIMTEIENLSDMHIRPQGTIAVSNLIGQTIAMQKLEEHNIFPQGSFLFENTLGRKLMIGRYKASLFATYGSSNSLPLVATVYFWVFPWKVATIALLVIVIAILTYLLLKRKKAKPSQE